VLIGGLGGPCSDKLVETDGKRLQPRFGGGWRSISEMVAKRLRAALKLLKHSFDAILISMGNPSEIEAVTVKNSVKPRRYRRET